MRAHVFGSLAELTSDSSAVILARPTGRTFTKPVPAGDGVTSYIQMSVLRVLDGSVTSRQIAVVSPGDDLHTGRSALLSSRSYLLFLTPAMYDRDRPAGGYAVAGGPGGVYSVDAGDAATYLRIDSLSVDLPSKIRVGSTTLPRVTKSEKQLLDEGPR